MIATVGKSEYLVESLPQVSTAYVRAIAEFEARGGRYAPRCEIRDDDGNVVAHVSRTGTIYPGAVMQLGAAPLYTPPRAYA